MSANRPRSGSFAALIDQVLDDQSALDGLAFAYAELGEADRQGLARAVLQDADDPTQALVAFLAVEEDPMLQQRLVGLIGKHGRIDQHAFLAGNAAQGAARLTQALPGLDPESLCITWNEGEIDSIEIESRTDVKSDPLAKPVAMAEVVELLTPLVWQHIRTGGELPSGVERFAGFFSIG